MADTKKCAHNACSCDAPPDRAFCSDYCEHTATSGPPREETVCRCGHPGCAGDMTEAQARAQRG